MVIAVLDFLFTLTIGQIVLANIIIILINIGFSLVSRLLVKKKFHSTKSVEETLYYSQKLSKYPRFLLLLVSIFISSLIIAPYAENFGNVALLIVMAVCLTITSIIMIVNQLVFFSLNRELRKTTSTRKEQLGMLIGFLILSAAPVLILVATNELISNYFQGTISRYSKWLIIGTVYLIISLALSFCNRFLLKAVPMEDDVIKERLISFIKIAGIDKVRLYVWPTKSNKHANALVSGVINKDIFLSDYLLDNFTMEETEAVLAHEIGHIKRHHLWIRTILLFGIFIIIPTIGTLVDKYGKNYIEVLIWLIPILYLLIGMLYLSVVNYYVSQVHEKQADNFVLKLGVDPLVYISALYKLAKLNHSVMRFGKLDEKFQTHPSIAKRINWIAAKGNKSQEEILEVIHKENGN